MLDLPFLYALKADILCARNSVHAPLQVSEKAFPVLAKWKRDFSLETILVELRR